MKNVGTEVKTWWGQTTQRQKITIVLSGSLFLAAIFFVFFYNMGSEYRLLYRELAPEDAAKITDWLKQEKIEYKLRGESAIYIPTDRVNEVKLQLAGKGLPKNKAVGFEIFDRSSFGSTEFVQQLNYTRALQGELSRTISHLELVRKATVHIARPKRSIFRRKKQHPTASVMLHVEQGYQLNRHQIYAIAYLVANAVEGLSASDVSILNQHGQLLYRKQEIGAGIPGINTALESQKDLEKYLQNKAQSMLDQMLGNKKAIVRVYIELDFSKTREVREIYDPEKQPIQNEKIRTSKTSETTNSGGTSSRSKVKKQRRRSNTKNKDQKEEDRTVQYALDKIVKEVENKVAAIKRLSIALVVDRELSSQLPDIGKLVKESVGYSKKRGDTFELTAITLHKPEEKPIAPLPFWQTNYSLIKLLLTQGVMLFAVLILAIVLWKAVRASRPEAEKSAQAAREEQAGTSGEVDIPMPKSEDSFATILHEVQEVARANNEGASSILRQWLHEESGS